IITTVRIADSTAEHRTNPALRSTPQHLLQTWPNLSKSAGCTTVHATRQSSRPDDSDADSYGWIEGNSESAIRRSLCSVGLEEPELYVLES
ncbi:MAG: hypothetical protein WBW84_24035, partial [Acidobacteriaceae bacterium]